MADFKTLPFDLNALVHYSLGFDQLWLAIEFLLDQAKSQNKLLDKMDKDVRSWTGLIDK